MKNRTHRLCLKFLFLIMAFPAAAGEYYDHPDPNSETIKDNTGNIATYLLNLGTFFGYDIKNPNPQNPPSQTLLNEHTEQTLQYSLFGSLLGAIPVNTVGKNLSNFVPATGQGGLALINSLANNVFLTPAYNDEGGKSVPNSGTQSDAFVSVSSLIDQQNFQNDPVSQSVLNILSTPDDSYCVDGACLNALTRDVVTANVIGTLPNQNDFVSYPYIQQFLSQLTSSILLAPLMYSTALDNSQTPATGLSAASQAQQAANFIRYVTTSVIPPTLPNKDNYNHLWTTATTVIDASKNPQGAALQLQAKTNLTNYLAKLRVYAAQMSVGVGNLYYIFQKRMPQSMGTSNDKKSSQALNEFQMATWRLYSPHNDNARSQWITQINDASAATVQKEIATLLAEINYQLYLTRQQQERMLLTESLVLLQNIHGSEPDSSFSPNSPDAEGQATKGS